MQISFRPSVTNKAQSNKQSQHPTFGAVNQKWLGVIQDDCSHALNTVLNDTHTEFKNNPTIMQDLKDTMERAFDLGYVYGENGKKAWKAWIARNIDPYLPKPKQ